MEEKINSIGAEMFKAVRWNFVSTAANYLGLFVSMVVLARFLTPEDYGITAISLGLTALFNLLVQFGFSQAIIGTKEVDKKFIDTMFTFSMMLAGGLYAILFFLSDSLGDFYHQPLLPILLKVTGLGLFVSLAKSIPFALLQRSLSYKSQTVVVLFSSFANTSAVLVLAVLGFGVWALILPILFGDVVGGGVSFIKSHYKPSLAFDLQRLKNAMNFGVSAFISNISNFVCNNAVQLTLGKIWTASLLGLYSFTASKYSKPFDIISTQLLSAQFSIFSKVSDELDRIRNAYLRITRLAFFLIPPVYVILIAGAPFLFPSVFGPQWNSAILPFQIFCIFPIVRTFSIGANGVLYALRLPHISARIVLFRVLGYVLTVALSIITRADIITVIAVVIAIDSVITFAVLASCLSKIECNITKFAAFIKAPVLLNATMSLTLVASLYILNFFEFTNSINFIFVVITAGISYLVIGHRLLLREWTFLRQYLKK